jgi:mycofactocin precursor
MNETSGTVGGTVQDVVEETGDALVESEDLVEEVSIDGMCGVY